MVRGARWIQLGVYALGALVAGCADPGTGASRPDPGAVQAAAPVEPATPVAPVEEEHAPAPPAEEPVSPMTPTPPPNGDPAIFVDIARQRLVLFLGDTAVVEYPVSTSKVGTGSESGSLRTPLGHHRVAEKFGDGAPPGTIFRSRESRGEVAEIHTAPLDVEEDLVLTRILWLEGLEPGRNQGPGIDSKSRYIYIHGTNEEGLIGTPASHGCVRMKNADVIDLCDRVPEGTEVWILESGG